MQEIKNSCVRYIDYNHLQFLTDLDSLEIEYLEIEKESLCSIGLNGLLRLNLISCHSLLKFKGQIIELKGLASLSAEVINLLVQFKGGLYLGLENLNLEQAIILAKHTGALSLTRLQSVDDSIVQALANYQGNVLELNALKSITKSQAEHIIKFKGDYLSFEGFVEISDEVASVLSKFSGTLFFNPSLFYNMNDSQFEILKAGSCSIVL